MITKARRICLNIFFLKKQVLLESNEDKDITDHPLPNLIYVSREKNKSVHHNFKGGALNSVVRFTYLLHFFFN